MEKGKRLVLGLEVVEGGLFEYTFKTLNEENQRIWQVVRYMNVDWTTRLVDTLYNTYRNYEE